MSDTGAGDTRSANAVRFAYHICHDQGTIKNGDLVPGPTITLTKPFRGPSNPPPEDAEYWRGYVEHWNQLLPDGLSFWGQKVLLGLLDDAFMGEREIRAEEIRQTYFRDQPSRLQAIFGCRTLEEAKQYRVEFEIPDASIWKLAAERIVEKDMGWMRRVNSAKELDNNIVRYWRGEQSPEGPLWECLMIPPVQVIERIDEGDRTGK